MLHDFAVPGSLRSPGCCCDKWLVRAELTRSGVHSRPGASGSVMPHSTPYRASFMPHDAPYHTSFTPVDTPLVTSFHTNGLGFNIRCRQDRGGRCEAEHSRESEKRKSLSTRDNFRSDRFTHIQNLPGWVRRFSCTEFHRPALIQVKGWWLARLRRFESGTRYR